jgi:hypothetical protein
VILITIPDTVGSGQPSLAEALAQGQQLPTVASIIRAGLLIILFGLIAIVRFQLEEF